jgi:hypothetical protein
VLTIFAKLTIFVLVLTGSFAAAPYSPALLFSYSPTLLPFCPPALLPSTHSPAHYYKAKNKVKIKVRGLKYLYYKYKLRLKVKKIYKIYKMLCEYYALGMY